MDFQYQNLENFPTLINALSIYINEIATTTPTPKYSICGHNDWIQIINIDDQSKKKKSLNTKQNDD